MSEDKSALALLFKVKNNQVNMMKNRGYDITNEKNLQEMSLQDFKEFYLKRSSDLKTTFKGSLNNYYEIKSNTGELLDSVYVYFFDTVKDKTQLCTSQVEVMLNLVTLLNKVKKIVLISEQKIHTQSESKIKAIKEKRFQHFLYKELSADIFDHNFVPHHKILSPEEVKEIKEKSSFDVGNSNLPEFRIDDAIVKYLWAVPGNIIEVKRKNIPPLLPVRASFFYAIVRKQLLDE